MVSSHLFAREGMFQTGQPPAAGETYGGSEEASTCSDLARLRDFAQPHGRTYEATGLAKGLGSYTARSPTPQAFRLVTVLASSNAMLQDPQPSIRDTTLPVVTWGIYCVLPGARTS